MKIYNRSKNLSRDANSALFLEAVDWISQGREFVLAILLTAQGSTPRDAGAKMLAPLAGEPFGTIGGGELENFVINRSRKMLEKREIPAIVDFEMKGDGGPVCGGRVKVYLEPVFSKTQVVIFGAGHVSAALSRLILELGWSVTVYDERQDRLDIPDFAQCKRVFAPFKEPEKHIDFHKNIYLLVMTPSHNHDFQVVKKVIEKPRAMLGVLCSRRKKEKMKAYLKSEGISDKLISGITAPVGLMIGSKTPQEIAVSIAGQLIKMNSDKKSRES